MTIILQIVMFEEKLFSNELLYCEGLYKPYLRGKIHALWLLLAPYAAYIVYYSCQNPIASYISLFGNVVCFSCSAVFHIGTWTRPTEIILQKLDHISISFWCVCMMAPFYNILPVFIVLPFYGLLATTFCINTYKILMSTPSTMWHVFVPGSIAPFLYFIYIYCEPLTWIYIWAVIACQTTGTIVFTLGKKYDWPGLPKGEIFHSISLGSSFFVFMVSLREK